MDSRQELQLAAEEIELHEADINPLTDEDGDTFLIKEHAREDRMIKSDKAREHRNDIKERLEHEKNRGYKGTL